MLFRSGIQVWLGLLGLPLGEQLIKELSEANQAPAPALLTEPEEQAITAGREMKAASGVDVSEGHGGRSAGRRPAALGADQFGGLARITEPLQ